MSNSETNVKGYLLMSIISAGVKGPMRGLEEKEIIRLQVKAIKNGENSGRHGRQDNEGLELFTWQIPDVPFNPSDTEPMRWIFNEDINQGFLEL
ncbi:hypothetical protein IFM46972_10944 [Aspergillus udagawae]|uniref:Uncharacterized protein n=1 Tax=Aspergillus udagawae TaxID=91492 RepID=A0A8H3SEA8_9EURO|nr:hypothetical protein IFM46972_10944 [Aspergillus udagawae]